MGIVEYTPRCFRGLSSDEKPTSGVASGDRFAETNTGFFFTWNGSIWVKELETAIPESEIVFDTSAGHDHDGSNSKSVGAGGAHAATHTNGDDDIQDATDAQKGLATAAQITKLDGITASADVTGSNTCDTPGGAGTDTTAVHDNEANEISALDDKTSPVSADVLIIEDSAASYIKKKVQISNLPAGTPGADSINDTHIDWGSGANQVDADDVPESATKKWAGETGATADQTGAEIKAAYEGEAETNAFTDAEKSKLGVIEASAVALATVKADADISDAISKKHAEAHAVASHSDTSVTGAELDADHSKLGGVAASADVTADNAPQAHAASHEVAGGDLVDHDNLTNFTADEHFTKASFLSGVAKITVGTVEPESPDAGDLWVDTN